MKKNTKLFIVLIILIITSGAIALFDTDSKKRNFETNIFQIGDTESIQSIQISANENDILMENQNESWTLNKKYGVDNDLIKILNTIMSQVVVKRPVAGLNRDHILAELEQNGRKIKVILNDNTELNFISGGNASKTASYFMDLSNEEVYVVEIPGYNNYISGIFELTENQWRDRLLFSSSWRTIKELNIDYLDRPDLQISFEDRFLKVADISKMDTTALLGYLQQFEYFQVNDYLERGNHPRYDSLLDTKPLGTIEILDIDFSKNRSLKIFPKIKSERFYLLTDESDQMMVVDQKRIEALLASNEKFKSQ